MAVLVEVSGQALSTLLLSLAALFLIIFYILAKSLRCIMSRTYSLSLLVGGGQLITLVLQTTQLQLQFVQTTVQFVDGALGVMQII